MHFKSVGIYFVFNVLNALLPLAILPVITRLLTPDDLGTLAIFNIFCSLASVLFRMEFNAALKVQWVASRDTVTRYLGTGLVFSCFLLFGGCLLVGLFSLFFPKWNEIQTGWLIAIVIIAFSRFHTVNLHHLFQIRNQALVYSLWGLIVNLATYGTSILLIMATSLRWEARAWTDFTVAIVSLIPAFYFLRRDYSMAWKFDFKTLREILRFSLPLLPSNLISYLFMFSDRLFLASLVGSKELGLYTVAIQLSSSISLFGSAVLPSWESWVFHKKIDTSNKDLRLVLKGWGLISALMILIMFFLPYVFEWLLPILTAKTFSESKNYLLPTLISATAASIFSFLIPIVVYLKQSKVIALVHVLMLLINILGLYPMIKVFGTSGAAYAIAASYLTGGFALVIFIQNKSKQAN